MWVGSFWPENIFFGLNNWPVSFVFLRRLKNPIRRTVFFGGTGIPSILGDLIHLLGRFNAIEKAVHREKILGFFRPPRFLLLSTNSGHYVRKCDAQAFSHEKTRF